MGQLVATAVQQNVDLSELPIETLQLASASISEDVYQVLTLEGSVAARAHYGGTAPKTVRAAIAQAKRQLDESD